MRSPRSPVAAKKTAQRTSTRHPSAGAVPRESLARRLHAMDEGIVLLEAPAGFGKTYALAQWCESARRARGTAVWIDLKHGESSPARLAQKITEAFDAQGLGHPSMHSLNQPHDRAFDYAGFLEVLRDRLTAHRRPVHLVFDDYQSIEGAASDELLLQLFEGMPKNVRMALATRRVCPIALSRILLQGRLLRIDGRSLLFSKAETRAFFGEGIRPSQLRQLYRLTEGWPAALELARMTLPAWGRTQSDIYNVSEFSRLIGDYCATEVLRHTERRAVDLLVDCAVLETLQPDQCDAVREARDSAEIIASLTAHETFIEAIDVSTNQWRIPPLLRRTLARRASERGSASLVRANLRAAKYFEARGQTLPALHHFLSAGEPIDAAAALERASPLTLAVMQGDEYAQQLLDLIPGAQLQAFPRLALCRVYLDFKRGLLDEARMLLEEIGDRTKNFTTDRMGGNDFQLRAEFLGVQLIMRFYSSSRAPLEYLKDLEQQMSVVGKAEGHLTTLYHLLLGLLYKLRGDLETAQSHFIQCEKLNLRERSPWTAVWLKYHFGSLSLARGQLMDARYHFQAGLRLWNSDFRSYPSYHALAQLALSEIDYEFGALAEAQDRLDEALYTAEHVEGWFEPYAALYEMQLMIHWHARRLDKIDALLAHGTAVQRVGIILGGFLHALRLRFALLCGRLDAAQTLVDTHGLCEKWAAHTFQDHFAYREWDLLGIGLCLLRIYQRRFGDARAIVEKLERGARVGGRGRTLAKAAILQAVIAGREGDGEQAVSAMIAALEMGHSQGYQRLFLDEAELVSPILTVIQERLPSVPAHLIAYAQSLSAVLTKKHGNGDKPSPLSDREQEVLRELSQGHANKLIARKLGISAPTVNFHVRNVFQKLGVRRRAAAVAEAHRRGWLS